MSEERYRWSKLNSVQLGKYAEFYTAMRFTEAGYEVFPSAVDDRGIDMLVRIGPGRCLEIQVKSERQKKSMYCFFKKRMLGATPEEISQRLRSGFCLSYLLFEEGREPEMYLIPGTVWLTPSKLFVSRNYPGLKSEPEFGFTASRANLKELERYSFSIPYMASVVEQILSERVP